MPAIMGGARRLLPWLRLRRHDASIGQCASSEHLPFLSGSCRNDARGRGKIRARAGWSIHLDPARCSARAYAYVVFVVFGSGRR